MRLIEKKVARVFGKKVYLLGRDKDGFNVYLEAPSWDCGWYWGFGYVERYTNKLNPEKAKDVSSHGHWDSNVVGVGHSKQTHEYCSHLNENNNFVASVLNDEESWVLAELMGSFYVLSKTARFFHGGGAHLTENPCKKLLKSLRLEKRINSVLLPAIFAEVDKLLSPAIVGSVEA